MANHTTPIEARFWKYVNKNGPLMEKMNINCWEYIPPRGYKNRRSVSFNIGKKNVEVGKVAWFISFGEFPSSGLSVIRRCGNYKCVNPEHLFLGDKYRMLSPQIIDDNGISWKHCTNCGKLLPFNSETFGFSFVKKSLLPFCRECGSIRTKKNSIKHWSRVAFYRAEEQHRTKNFNFDLTIEFILDLYSKQGGLCYWLGIPMETSMIHRYPFSPSLDRVDRKKGYTKDNVILCCQFMNVGRNSCSYEDFIDSIKKYPEIFGKGLWNNE